MNLHKKQYEKVTYVIIKTLSQLVYYNWLLQVKLEWL